MDLLPLFILTPVLFLTAISDLRHMRIPNLLSILALALFVATCWVLPLGEIGLRLLSACIVFVVGFVLFAVRILGGGDVKILSALMLFIPSSSLVLFAYVFSASMLLGILSVIVMRSIPVPVGGQWVSMRAKNTLPMGISIAMAGVLQLLILFLMR